MSEPNGPPSAGGPGGGSGGGPCAGLRVLEFATMVSGPFAGQYLADLGGEVIKVEPLAGDPMRLVRPIHGGLSAIFLQFNHSKRSIALDLKAEDGLRIARDLAHTADVVLENNRQGVMDRLGLGYEALSAGNKRLIYLSVTGFGETGPYADRPAYEHLLQAYSGMMSNQGEDGAVAPIKNLVVDKSTALLGVNAILAALLHRERTGLGQRLSISLMRAVASFLLPEQITSDTFLADGVARPERRNSFIPIRTADGYVQGYVLLRGHCEAICRTFGREDLLDDPRFRDSHGLIANYEAFWEEMQAVAGKFTTAQLIAGAARHGAPLAPVNTVPQFLDDPQVRHSAVFAYLDDPALGPVRLINHPVTFEKSPAAPPRRAPLLGEDTNALLAELGHNPEQQAALRQRQIVA
jgi:crotonobetainyl-CoA:carnitine CoA-transferase CaiB-like acyl-CoA transferase